MAMQPVTAGRAWILGAWLPFSLLNILGEELVWRGVVLPRQELVFGRWAWLVNETGWWLVHVAFPWQVLLTLCRPVLVVPYLAQRSQNTWVGIIVHAGLNGSGFLMLAFGLASPRTALSLGRSVNRSRLFDRTWVTSSAVNRRHRSTGIILLVIFFAAGAVICLVTMLALAFPGGFLEPVWRLKPEARADFQQIGNWSVALMAAVGTACGFASIGLAKNAGWGRLLAIGILIVNLFGDTLNAFLRHDPITLIGLPIGGLMIWYLVRKDEG